MCLAFGAPPCVWLLALLCCVVLCLLFEPFVNCRELGGITVADKLLFFGAQAFPCSAGVTVTEQFVPIEKVIGRYGFTVELDVRDNATIDLNEDAVEFLRYLLKPPDLKGCAASDPHAVQLLSEPRDLPFAIRQAICCLLGARLGSVPGALRLLQLLLFRVHCISPFSGELFVLRLQPTSEPQFGQTGGINQKYFGGNQSRKNRSAVGKGDLRTGLTKCVPGILARSRPIDTLQRFAWWIDVFAFVGFDFFIACWTFVVAGAAPFIAPFGSVIRASVMIDEPDFFVLIFIGVLFLCRECLVEKPARVCPDTNPAVLHQVEREDTVFFTRVFFA